MTNIEVLHAALGEQPTPSMPMRLAPDSRWATPGTITVVVEGVHAIFTFCRESDGTWRSPGCLYIPVSAELAAAMDAVSNPN